MFREKESNYAFLLFCFPAFQKHESSALKACFIYIEAPVSDSSSRTSKVDKEGELNIFREKKSNPAFLLSCFPKA